MTITWGILISILNVKVVVSSDDATFANDQVFMSLQGVHICPTSLASSTFWSLFVCFFVNWHMKGKRLWYSPHCKFLLVMCIYAFCEQVGPWLPFVPHEKNICCIKMKWYTHKHLLPYWSYISIHRSKLLHAIWK